MRVIRQALDGLDQGTRIRHTEQELEQEPGPYPGSGRQALDSRNKDQEPNQEPGAKSGTRRTTVAG